jgi:AbrB family looped-hinge helix DNA binding protein
VSHYDIEGIATVDSRGQIVLPKTVRDALGLEAGSKLAVVLKQNDGAPCCVTLMPAARLESRVRELIDSGGSDV